MGLFSKKKIQGDELLTYLDYLGDEWKLRAFQDKEAQLYTQALDGYSPKPAAKNTDALKDLYAAANRMAQSAAELVRRKDAMTSVPDKATSLFFAWHAAYTDYLAWTVAQVDTIEAKIEGVVPDAAKLKELQGKSEESRADAETEEAKLMKQLGMTPLDAEQLRERADQAANQDRWQPRNVTYLPKRQTNRR
jgi:hypothetical protein